MDKEIKFILDCYSAIVQSIIILVFTFLMIKQHFKHKKFKKKIAEYDLKIEQLKKENENN